MEKFKECLIEFKSEEDAKACYEMLEGIRQKKVKIKSPVNLGNKVRVVVRIVEDGMESPLEITMADKEHAWFFAQVLDWIWKGDIGIKSVKYADAKCLIEVEWLVKYVKMKVDGVKWVKFRKKDGWEVEEK